MALVASPASVARRGIMFAQYNPQSANQLRSRDVIEELSNFDVVGLIGTHHRSTGGMIELSQRLDNRMESRSSLQQKLWSHAVASE
eukprot:9499545-Pyramimonas_sp.AAC.1